MEAAMWAAIETMGVSCVKPENVCLDSKTSRAREHTLRESAHKRVTVSSCLHV